MSTATAPPATALWPHQTDAAQRALQHPGFLIAHEVGVGKSATAISVLDTVGAQRVLVLCPKSVLGVWPDQLIQWSDRDWHVFSGTVNGARGPLRNPSVARRAVAIVDATKHAAIARRPLAVVVNYEASWVGDMAKILLGTPWDAVILDEIHRTKSASGKQSRFAAKVCAKTRARGGRILGLTGTPMPHTPLDLWAQFRALDGGETLGRSYRAFVQLFGEPETIWAAGGTQRTVYKGIRPTQMPLLTGLVAPLMHQVKAADVLDLPAVTDLDRTCELEPATRRVYDGLEKDLIAEIDAADERGDVVTAANAMVLVTRLAQATSGFAVSADTHRVRWLADPPEKARLLADILEDLPEREPVVVFCRFHADLDAVRGVTERLGRRYGELSGRRRDGLTSHATMSPDIDILGCQIQAGGTGISLIRARVAVYYTTGFELATYIQSRGRLHRAGQERPVVFFHLLAEQSIDRAIKGALAKREEVVDHVLALLRSRSAPQEIDEYLAGRIV